MELKWKSPAEIQQETNFKFYQEELDELYNSLEEKRKNMDHQPQNIIFKQVNKHFFFSNESPTNKYQNSEFKNVWRDEVLKDYNSQCYICDESEDLQAHHLNNRNDFPDEMFDRDNGIILCKEHHIMFHSWMGGLKVPCTKEDFQRWLEE